MPELSPPDTTLITVLNCALFARFSEPGFLSQSLAALAPLAPKGKVVVFSDSQQVINSQRQVGQCEIGDIQFDPMFFDSTEVASKFRSTLSGYKSAAKRPVTAIVDLSWVTEALDGGGMFESWGELTELLSLELGCSFVSLYNLDLLVENRMQAALRAHPQFIAPSGLYDNPFWLPARLSLRGTVDQQMAYLLGRLMHDYSDLTFFDQGDRSFARGANPQWLPSEKHIEFVQTQGNRWHIHCLGQLRVYKEGHQWVDWKLKGGSPNKSRALFAYLLQAGEKGAHADRIGEFLWSTTVTEKVKRARLHHAVAMLRKTLVDPDSVVRNGEFYRLNAPEGSWIDIASFEQTCRRGLALFKQGREAEALRIYQSAETLYGGDLFEDIPVQYVHSELDDWCLPRRRWFREMAIKLYCDMTVLLRGQGQTDEALDKCQKAIALDPASEDANAEAMRIFHSQGRVEAITRQYRQYLSATEAIGGSSDAAAIHRLHDTLL